MSYEIQFHKRVFKDLENIKNIPSLYNKTKALLKLLENNPYEIPPSYEKLTGTLKGFYFRRLNKQHRLIYLVDDKIKSVRIVSMWTLIMNKTAKLFKIKAGVNEENYT